MRTDCPVARVGQTPPIPIEPKWLRSISLKSGIRSGDRPDRPGFDGVEAKHLAGDFWQRWFTPR
jgi:hypothetical protein